MEDNKKEMLVRVEKINAADLLPGYKTVSKFSNAIVVYPGGKKDPKIVNFCSDTYTLVYNRDIIEKIEEGLKSNFQIEASYFHKNHAKFYMDYFIKDKEVKVQKGDVVGVKIRVQNSYDGRLKFGYNFGLHRLVCTNGMTMPDKSTYKKESSMHTPQLISRDLVSKMVDEAGELIGDLKEIVKPYQILTDSKVPGNVDAITARMHKIAEDTKYPKRQINEAAQIALNEMKQLRAEMNDWLIYQAMNNILNHSTEIKMEYHRREEVDQELIRKFLNK